MLSGKLEPLEPPEFSSGPDDSWFHEATSASELHVQEPSAREEACFLLLSMRSEKCLHDQVLQTRRAS